ncbi:general secretion pathway protein GspK [Mesorhizobium sp. ZC-5]|uniref:general secretion pathway protein GspK n=1 Tax=Mesorhizobium sp. ZC-5 TaxID=2986066 RepID=UPI0021E6F213|nr:general secretion pathway protein GspK [Mesorhizobium sp. ZC-5]MCV3243107.1 general secretion pathway protein GspK [Mesorhizobium sp. ZC-5]
MTGSVLPAANGPESGFALIAVLVFLLLVAAVVAPFAVAARTTFLIALNTRDQSRLDTMADGLSTLVALRVIGNDGAALLAELPPNSSPVSCAAGKYTIGIRLQDQAGLIDLNVADEATLAVGLRSIGIVTGAATAAETIVKYRSYQPEDSRPAIAVTGGLKSGPFESVIELSDLKPLASLEPADLHRAFTVHSGQSAVAASRAPAALAGLLRLPADDGAGGSSMRIFAVEVAVQDQARAAKGYAGFLAEPSSSPNPPFRRVEPLFETSFGGRPTQAAHPCPRSLQRDIAELVATR